MKLPGFTREYRKGLVVSFGALLYTLDAALNLDSPPWLHAVVAAGLAVGVIAVPNRPAVQPSVEAIAAQLYRLVTIETNETLNPWSELPADVREAYVKAAQDTREWFSQW